MQHKAATQNGTRQTKLEPRKPQQENKATTNTPKCVNTCIKRPHREQAHILGDVVIGAWDHDDITSIQQPQKVQIEWVLLDQAVPQHPERQPVRSLHVVVHVCKVFLRLLCVCVSRLQCLSPPNECHPVVERCRAILGPPFIAPSDQSSPVKPPTPRLLGCWTHPRDWDPKMDLQPLPFDGDDQRTSPFPAAVWVSSGLCGEKGSRNGHCFRCELKEQIGNFRSPY